MIFQSPKNLPKTTKIDQNFQNRRIFFSFLSENGKMLFREITELEKQNKNETVPKIWDNRKKKNYFQSILSLFSFHQLFFQKRRQIQKNNGSKKENKIFLNQSDSVSKIFAKFFKKFWREFFCVKCWNIPDLVLVGTTSNSLKNLFIGYLEAYLALKMYSMLTLVSYLIYFNLL